MHSHFKDILLPNTHIHTTQVHLRRVKKERKDDEIKEEVICYSCYKVTNTLRKEEWKRLKETIKDC